MERFLPLDHLLEEMGCWTTTSEFGLIELPSSFSELCGEIKRAVGRGPLVEGPRLFFRIGCGATEGAFNAADDVVVLNLLLTRREISAVLGGPGDYVWPRFSKIPNLVYDGMRERAAHTNGELPSSRFEGPS